MAATEAIRQMPGDGRSGETRGLEGEQASPDPDWRIAHVVRQVDRQEGEQRALRHGPKRRSRREQHQRAVAQQNLELAHVGSERLRLAFGPFRAEPQRAEESKQK
jgi:hypothetical protein